MKLAVNNVAVGAAGLQKELGRLTEASREGQLSERGTAGQFQGAYAGIVKGVNEMLDAILLPIGEGNRILAQISNGKIDELIAQTYKGDHEKMKLAVNNVAVVLQGLQKELARLTDASRDGQLAERGKAGQFQGAYAGIVKGVNEMLDAILLPIGEGNRILSLIRGGNLREKVEIACKGDHEKMKNAINGVHALADGSDRLRHQDRQRRYDRIDGEGLRSGPDSRVAGAAEEQHQGAGCRDATMLVKAAAEGKLGARADAAKHHGRLTARSSRASTRRWKRSSSR